MKYSNFKSLLIVVVCFFTTLNITAQKAEKPDFSYDVGNVDWMKVSDAGTLIISTDKGIHGIQPNEPSPSFLFDKRKNIKEENFHLQPGTPYAMFIANGMKGVTFVLDVVSGKTIFDSQENGYTFLSNRDIILPENKLVISGMRKIKGKMGQEFGISVFDLASGEEEYSIPQKGNNIVTGTSDMFDGKLIIPRKKGLECIDLTSGNVVWTADIKNITSVEVEGNSVYAYEKSTNGKNTTIYKVDLNGNLSWKDGYQLKGMVKSVDYLDQGIAILTDVDNGGKKGLMKLAAAKSESKIYFLDAKTGEDLWDKAPKTKGFVSHFYTEKDGIIFGVASGGINKIKYDGTPLWKKPLKTGADINTLAKTDKGILYITSSDADIIDETTGESVLGKKLSYKSSKSVASTYDATNNRYLLSCSDGLYSIDANSGTSEIIANPKFEEKEMPTNIEMRGSNILLSSSQNLMLLDSSGKEIYHKHYKSPSNSGFLKVLTGAIAVASTAMASAAAFRAGANRNSIGNYNSYGQQMDTYSKGFSQIGSASFAAMSKRYKASAATKNDQFILTKLDSGVGLVNLDKDNGNLVKEILLKDKKPTYEIDSVERILYYLAGKNTIYAYKI